jgi:hypothetical protein
MTFRSSAIIPAGPNPVTSVGFIITKTRYCRIPAAVARERIPPEILVAGNVPAVGESQISTNQRVMGAGPSGARPVSVWNRPTERIDSTRFRLLPKVDCGLARFLGTGVDQPARLSSAANRSARRVDSGKRYRPPGVKRRMRSAAVGRSIR